MMWPVDFFRVLIMLAMVSLGACATWPPGGDDRAADAVMIKRSQMLMGTLVFVTAVAPDEGTAQRAAAAGLAEIRRLEELWSTWISTSELSRVNAAAGVEPVRVSAETYELIRRALEIGTQTEGAFNVAIGPAVGVWGFPERPRLPPEQALERVRPLTDPSAVRLDQSARTLYLARPDMQLDVGGIGKGYAADLSLEAMRAAGATAAVVALSGDIKTFGRMPDGEPFLFGIQHPRKSGVILARLALENEAVSTAGDYQRYFELDGSLYHHILDPSTLHPARACQSVTIVAKEGILADGFDTGIFVMGPERGMRLIESLPGLEAVIVDHAGVTHVSSGLRGRVMFDSPARDRSLP